MIRIIPSLLLYNNTLVKGVKFSNYKNAGNPVTTVLGYQGQKADEIFLINLNNYKREGEFNLDGLKKISKVCNTPITFGGSIDNFEKVNQIFLSGADKIYISKYFFKNIKFIDKISNVYGSQSIVGGLNLIKNNEEYKLLDDESKKINPLDHLKKLIDNGIGEIKITFVDLEGSNMGLDLKYIEKILHVSNLPTIFEGGIGNLLDLKKAASLGVDSFSIGTFLTFRDYNIIKIKQYLKNEGFEIRL